MGGALLPDTPAWSDERREERLWKCVTRRRGLLDKEARARLRGVAEQVRSHYVYTVHGQQLTSDVFRWRPG